MTTTAAGASTQEVIGLLDLNGHEKVAQVLRERLASANQGDIGAMQEIISLAQVRALGDLLIASLEWLEWLKKVDELRQRWQGVIRTTANSSGH
jgi:hypothetical protein